MSDFSSNDRSASDPATNKDAFTPSFNQNRDTEFGSSNRRSDDAAVLGSDNLNRDSDNLNRGHELGDHTRQREFERQGADYSASGVDSRGGLGSTGLAGNTTTADTVGPTREHRSGLTGHRAGEHDRDHDYDNQQSSDNKPGLGERLKGSVEKATGQMTGNRERVVRGEERKTGGNTDNY